MIIDINATRLYPIVEFELTANTTGPVRVSVVMSTVVLTPPEKVVKTPKNVPSRPPGSTKFPALVPVVVNGTKQ